jgi:hypothetical protein
VGYSPNQSFFSAFGENAFPGKSLLNVLNGNGGGLQALGRHAVAALLNASNPGIDYAFTQAEVIDAFQDVFPGTASEYEDLKDIFATENERGCDPKPTQTPTSTPTRTPTSTPTRTPTPTPTHTPTSTPTRTPTPTPTLSPPQGGEGCTPGYWKQSQHFQYWMGYSPNQSFITAFGENAFPGKSLMNVLNSNGGGLKALGRHAVAALLNASNPNINYAFTKTEVIDAFRDVYPGTANEYEDLKDTFEDENQRGCDPKATQTATPAPTGTAAGAAQSRPSALPNAGGFGPGSTAGSAVLLALASILLATGVAWLLSTARSRS